MLGSTAYKVIKAEKSASKMSVYRTLRRGQLEFCPERHGLPSTFSLIHFGPRQEKIKVPEEVVHHFISTSGLNEDLEMGVIHSETELQTETAPAREYGINVTMTPIKNSEDLVLVQTIDVLYPMVDDPYIMGKIACAEVLSNLYAAGVTECDSIRIAFGIPHQFTDKEKDIIIPYILNGFNDLAREARTETSVGKMTGNPWLTIGGIATSLCDPQLCTMRYNANVGSVLVLTKPLGTRIATSAFQWLERRTSKWEAIKNNISCEEVRKAYHIAIDSMTRLNRTAAMLMQKYEVCGATDVGEDGLVTSVQRLAQRQENPISFIILNVPVIAKMQIIDRATSYSFQLTKGICPETSGGLLVCMSREDAVEYSRDIETVEGYKAWVIGVAVLGDRTVRMSEQPMVIQVTSNMSNVNFIA